MYIGGGVKAVHDLEWVMSSPHLLTPEYDVLPPSLCSYILHASDTKAWLAGLHANPEPLHTFLSRKLC
ncbi:hypothetical protein H310_13431 [Aphanomyces invadans]|uniref:Uncharacterized protein n=1 Tax=Aphanomyces invadans TaxID=157072 RepID=A0A024TDF3_9STRA|nr:hypothetical protein H310_13431 [Aphanomyces invadans]ETV92190.1 hypothetical protein H310_13431 [Aphanomyces invadans]|eukprot:XP_008879154.1 hypothetical protein H310_13431 [Aphanomyces invadans]